MTLLMTEREIKFATRGDGSRWKVKAFTFKGSLSGPRTGIVAGIWGDKPRGVLAAHEVIKILMERKDLRGSVTVLPAVNPGALEIGQRIGPDSLLLNRRFPGSPTGFLTDQNAHHLTAFLDETCDAVLDLHSSTPTMDLNYTYDFGCNSFSASFGVLPVILNRTHPTQLSSVMAGKGIISCLAEFGGPKNNSIKDGVVGTLNVLRARGNLDEPLEAPTHVDLIEEVQLVLSSSAGIFVHRADADVSKPISVGEFGSVINVQNGHSVEKFEIRRDGGVLLMLSASSVMVSPGTFLFMVGFPKGRVRVPSTGELEFSSR